MKRNDNHMNEFEINLLKGLVTLTLCTTYKSVSIFLGLRRELWASFQITPIHTVILKELAKKFQSYIFV